MEALHSDDNSEPKEASPEPTITKMPLKKKNLLALI